MFTVGRTAELLRVSLLGRAEEESALLIVGPSGAGKTHLLDAALSAATPGAVMLRTNPAESAWPLAGVSALLSLLTGAGLPDTRDHSRLIATDPQGIFEAASELLDILRSLSLPPTLALVDDIDLMDGASQMLIGFISGRLRSTGLRIVATATLGHPSPSLSRMTRLDLRKLGQADMNRLALNLADGVADEGGLFALARQCDGNPRAMQELIRDLAPSELSGATALRLPAPAGPTAHRHAAESLEFVDRASRRILERLSAAPATARLVATRGDPVIEDALQDLVDSGLVEQRRHSMRIRSALLRSHLYWGMTSQERRKLHATEEAATSDDPVASAWHSSFSAVDRCTPTRLMEAAVSFARDGETSVATEYAERARALAEGDSFAPELFVALSEVFLGRGELALAARYAGAGLRMAFPLTTRLRFDLVRTKIEFMNSKQVPDFDGWLDGYAAADPQGTRELLTVAAFCRAVRFEPSQARWLLDRAERLLSDTPWPGGALADHMIRAITGDTTDAPLPTTHHDVGSWQETDVLLLAHAEMVDGNYAVARSLCGLVLGRDAIGRLWSSAAHHCLAEIEIRSGRFASARREIARSGILETTDLRPAFAVPLEAWLAYADNRVDEALTSISTQLGNIELDPGPATIAHLYLLRAEMLLLRGDADGAILALGHADALDRDFDNPAVLRVFPELVEVHDRAGRLAEILPDVDRFLERCRRHPSSWATHAQARVEALIASDSESIALFEKALHLLDPADSNVDRGRLYTVRAERLDRMGNSADARRSYLEAREAFSSGGALMWVAHIDRQVMHVAAAPADGDHIAMLGRLSEEERRIVEYVKLGYRNKEIAAKLHMAVRTVELRLTNIYRVTSVPSRAHLIARLSG